MTATIHDDPYIYDPHPHAAGVLVYYQSRIILVRQYREPVDASVYELPAGGCETGEAPEDGARRELREETGLICGTLHPLGAVYSDPCVSNHVAHLFFTNDIIDETQPQFDDDEQLTVHRFEPQIILDAIKNGEWKSAELGHALLLAKLNGFLD
ncbi:NUDIX hydrolase [Tuberibacillus sp. Marseille-P3662]|uniref:NUDIX hydrolase n=1 Tax=Tuberibacillus sp. Marseille-P3662 TaxID=1965358 RepID=UPI001593CC52|nr:NUDIX hydrolase [Tuberibacillus sp. Marseille-P3662]